MRSEAEWEHQDEVQPAPVRGTMLGVPLGDLGWFTSILMGLATGFAAFFAATFVGIVVILIAHINGHQTDYTLAYRRIGLPIGLLVGVFALGYLGILWVRRITRKA